MTFTKDQAYAIAAVQGYASKPPVRIASQTHIDLVGLPKLQGVQLKAGDRVLAMGEALKWQNGIYVVAATNWARAADSATADDLLSMMVWVEEGTLAATAWVLATKGNIDLTSSNLVYLPLQKLADNLPAVEDIIDGKTGRTCVVSEHPDIEGYGCLDVNIVKATTLSLGATVLPANTAATSDAKPIVVAFHPDSPLPVGGGALGEVTIGDGTTSPVAVVTAAVTTGAKALAVALSPDSPLPEGTNPIGEVKQGLAAVTARAWPIRITDATRDLDLTAPSTPAAVTDIAVPVAISPNDHYASADLVLDDTLEVNTQSCGTVRVQLSGANIVDWVLGFVVFEGTLDDDRWDPVFGYNTNGSQYVDQYFGDGVLVFPCAGLKKFRVRADSITGTAHVRIEASLGSNVTFATSNIYDALGNAMPSMDAPARSGYVIHNDGSGNTLPAGDAHARAIFMIRGDGTNETPAMDDHSRAGYQKISDGTTHVHVTTAGNLPSASPQAIVISPSHVRRATYSVAGTTAALSASRDFLTFKGDGTNVFRITKIGISVVQDSSPSSRHLPFKVVYRDAADTDGASPTTLTPVAHDQSNQGASTAVVKLHPNTPTVNSTNPGNVRIVDLFSPYKTDSVAAQHEEFTFDDSDEKVMINDNSSQICLSLGDGDHVPTSAYIHYYVQWTEWSH